MFHGITDFETHMLSYLLVCYYAFTFSFATKSGEIANIAEYNHISSILRPTGA